MLDLSTDDRDELLEAFQLVIQHLQTKSDEHSIEALRILAEGDFKEGLDKADEAIVYDKLLTSIRSYLTLEYRKVAQVH